MKSKLVKQSKQVKSLNSVKFITLTNNGYLDYTLNCLKSLELINFKVPLHSYAIDQQCHNFLKSKGYNSTCLKLTNVSSKFEIWDSKNTRDCCEEINSTHNNCTILNWIIFSVY